MYSQRVGRVVCVPCHEKANQFMNFRFVRDVARSILFIKKVTYIHAYIHTSLKNPYLKRKGFVSV